MNWSKLQDGRHAGKTLAHVMFEDPDFVLGALGRDEFEGVLADEAAEVCRRAARIRIPREDGDEQMVLFFHLLPNGEFGGYAKVAKSDPKRTQYRKFSVAESNYFDITIPRRIAPHDISATATMMRGLLFELVGDPNAKLSADDCADFFNAPDFIDLDAVECEREE
jgi:hypothetical protein